MHIKILIFLKYKLNHVTDMGLGVCCSLFFLFSFFWPSLPHFLSRGVLNLIRILLYLFLHADMLTSTYIEDGSLLIGQ